MIDRILHYVDNHEIIRRFVVLTTVGLTVHSYWWATQFAMMSDKPGLEIAGILTAVTAPISWLQKEILLAYLNGKTK
jgi:hypothetical protein